MKFWSKILSWVLVAWTVLLPTMWNAHASYTSPAVASTVSTTYNYNTATSIDGFYQNLNGTTSLTWGNRIDMSRFVNDKFSSDINTEMVLKGKTETSVKDLWEKIVHKVIMQTGLKTRFNNAKTVEQKRAVLNDASIMILASFNKNTQLSKWQWKDLFDEAKWYVYALQIIENFAKSNWITNSNGWEFSVVELFSSHTAIKNRLDNGKIISPLNVFTQWRVTNSGSSTPNINTWGYQNQNNHNTNGNTNTTTNDNITQRVLKEARDWMNQNAYKYTMSEVNWAVIRDLWAESAVTKKVIELKNSEYKAKVISNNDINRFDWSWDKVDKIVQETENNKAENSYDAFIKSWRSKWYSDREILNLSIQFNWKNSNATKRIAEKLWINY